MLSNLVPCLFATHMCQSCHKCQPSKSSANCLSIYYNPPCAPVCCRMSARRAISFQCMIPTKNKSATRQQSIAASKKMAGDGVISMNSLKQRMQEVQEELIKFKDLYEKSAKELETENDKNKKFESETRELNRKISLMEDEYDQQNARYRSTCEKLDETMKVAEECEKQRKILDHRRIVDEDKLGELEQYFRETSEAAIESERRYDDVSRKLAAAEADLEKAVAKTESTELNAKNLQEDLRALNSKLKSMQAKVDKAAKKEANFDKDIEVLRGQLQKVESHGNESDRTTSKLQRELDQLQDELLQVRLQCQTLRNDTEPHSREIRSS